jgi:hypothetical protein
MWSHETTKHIGARVVNFATCKNFLVKCTVFPHRNNHKHNLDHFFGKEAQPSWSGLDGQGRNAGINGVRYFRGTDYDTDHNMVVAKLRETLAVSKRAAQKVDVDMFILKN